MLYNVKPTNTQQRQQAKDDYIIVVNSTVKNRLGLRKTAVVKYFLINDKPKERELRTLSAFGKVIVDNSLKDNEVAIDQTIRNAIGIPFGDTQEKYVKIEKMHLTIFQRICSTFHLGRYLYLRVNKPDVIDIEKKYCRVSEDTISILSTKPGKQILVENCLSDLKLKFSKIVEICDTHDWSKLNACIENLDKEITEFHLTTQEHEECFNKLIINSGSHKVIDILRKLEDISTIVEKQAFKKQVKNLIEYLDWQIITESRKHTEKIIVYAVQGEARERIKDIQSKQSQSSFYSRYPNSEEIFHISPDLKTIHLDLFYRDLLNVDLLDNIKVKRYWFDILKSELVEYGLIFILTIFTALVAISPSNLNILPYSIMFSLLFTSIIIFYRSK